MFDAGFIGGMPVGSRDLNLNRPAVIQVFLSPPHVVLNGTTVRSALPIDELLRVIGSPSRVYTGWQPAPAGHRNNPVHVFDELGLTVSGWHDRRKSRSRVINYMGKGGGRHCQRPAPCHSIPTDLRQTRQGAPRRAPR